MGSAPTPPPVPDASAIAGAQSKANIGTASAQSAINNVNQITPYGNLTYQQTGVGPGGVPTYTASQSLGQGQQKLLDTGTQLLENIAPNYTGGPNTLPTVQSAERQYMEMMQPFFDQQTSTTQSGLRNQGFVPGDTGYDTSMRNLQQGQTSSVAQNIPGWYNMAVNQYQLPLQTAEQMISPQQAPFYNTPQTGVPATDVNSAYNTQQQAAEYNYGQQMQNYSSQMGGLFGIPSAVLGGWAKGGFPGMGTAASALGSAGSTAAGAIGDAFAAAIPFL